MSMRMEFRPGATIEGSSNSVCSHKKLKKITDETHFNTNLPGYFLYSIFVC
ncbi:hypothetical protein SAMN05444274_103461 [Mariniphaga anaerophila]|uniref:Uncharacterized protein n=1 Tax=Mariniphaga anaerophila TaxID=1484053 RepID=A0A1M4YUB6_9BACT|nr:hypothetical protein SAMN05444274_103461 [Mariniphaga anaerophila]